MLRRSRAQPSRRYSSGVGASLGVRDLFQASKRPPASCSWTDQRARSADAMASAGGGNDEREQTLNQLLVEMDGFEMGGQPVIASSCPQPARRPRPGAVAPRPLRPPDRRRPPRPQRTAQDPRGALEGQAARLEADQPRPARGRRLPGSTGLDLAGAWSAPGEGRRAPALQRAGAWNDRPGRARGSDHARRDRPVSCRPNAAIRASSGCEAYHEMGHALVRPLPQHERSTRSSSPWAGAGADDLASD